MTEIPADNYAASWEDGARTAPPLVGSERAILTSFLDWHRTTFELKCADLSPAQLSDRACPPSTLSLHGIARHLAAVERWWFQIQFAGEDVAMLFYSDEEPEQDFDDLGGDPRDALAVWRSECARAREIVAVAELDDTGVHRASGDPISLRRILVHMTAEYARHNGHADLLRERIDGRTGH